MAGTSNERGVAASGSLLPCGSTSGRRGGIRAYSYVAAAGMVAGWPDRSKLQLARWALSMKGCSGCLTIP